MTTMPARQPMLATPGTHLPTGEEWVHEVKWDGVRVLADVVPVPGRPPQVGLASRKGIDITADWPAIVALAPTDLDLCLDGELVALDETGRPDFRSLSRGGPATYLVFDVLRAQGHDVTGLPWRERRLLLESLGLTGWQVPATYDDGPALLAATRAQRLEGVVSKRRASRYRPGVRSPDWVKLVNRTRASYVVGGWRPQQGTADRLAALLVGEPSAGGLLYRGRVGSGIGPKESARLRALLTAAGESPFADEVPRVDAAGTFWCRPVLVVEVETHGIGYQRLRQPAYLGVRTDLDAEDLT
jgi:bifunctional non-homologous end joining protein LigD